MPTVADVLSALEVLAPSRFTLPGDKVGLQIGEPSAQVSTVLLSLDRSLAAVNRATFIGAELLISHHPLIWDPVATITSESLVGRTILSLIGANMAHIACHTNWDCAPGGINDTLAKLLGLQDIKPFGTTSGPEGHPISRKGALSKPMSFQEFVAHVDSSLATTSFAWAGGQQKIETVGVCGGAADDEWAAALAGGCDVLVTGEVKQHHALDATAQGISMVAAGHFATEHPGVVELAEQLRALLPDVTFEVFTPSPGEAGRPL